jgi:hypothetical protein
MSAFAKADILRRGKNSALFDHLVGVKTVLVTGSTDGG